MSDWTEKAAWRSVDTQLVDRFNNYVFSRGASEAERCKGSASPYETKALRVAFFAAKRLLSAAGYTLIGPDGKIERMNTHDERC